MIPINQEIDKLYYIYIPSFYSIYTYMRHICDALLLNCSLMPMLDYELPCIILKATGAQTGWDVIIACSPIASYLSQKDLHRPSLCKEVVRNPVLRPLYIRWMTNELSYRLSVYCDILDVSIGSEIMRYDSGSGYCPLDFRESWRDNQVDGLSCYRE